jgi:ankyrin repeat protein
MDEFSIPKEQEEFFLCDPMIFDRPISIDTRTVDGDTLLHRAIQRGRLDFARVLVSLGADVNAIGDMGNTAAHYLAEEHVFDESFFRFLVERGAKIETRNEFGMSVAEWAVECGVVQDLTALAER